MSSFTDQKVGPHAGEQEPLRIAIIGAGIAGLSAAIGILKAQKEGSNVVVDIYEGAPAFAEIGAGVYIGTNAQVALQLLGAGSAYNKISNETDPDRWFDVTAGVKEHPFNGINVGSVLGHRAGTGGLHRADFLNELIALVPREVIHFDRRCTSYSPSSDHITLSFVNGPPATADVVIASDGIKSRVREQLYERKGLPTELQKAHYSEWTVWRGFIPRERFDAIMGPDYPPKQMHCGRDRHLTHYPLRQGAIINVVAYVRDRDHKRLGDRTGPWSEPRQPEELLAEFESYNDTCKALLKEIKAPSMWGVFELPVINEWIDERIAIVGDAAHGMTPHQGAGSGQAIEDALFIVNLLTAPATVNHADPAARAAAIQRALEVYFSFRHERGTKVQTTSREAGRMYDFDGPDGDDLEKVFAGMKNRMRWIWEYPLAEEVKRAVGMLQEKPETAMEFQRSQVPVGQVEARL